MAELSFFVFPNFSKQTRAQSGTPKGTRRMGESSWRKPLKKGARKKSVQEEKLQKDKRQK